MEGETRANGTKGGIILNVFSFEIDPKELRLLELNARYMRHEEYSRLVNNIKRDGKLTSAPFCCKEPDGKYLVLSGNHRVMASIEAGITKIMCLVTDDPLSEEQKIAIQLSHNAISGQDDLGTLKLLYEKIFDVEMKKYSGLDDKTLELLQKMNGMSMTEANLKFLTLNLTFLPNEIENAQKILKEALETATKADITWLARMSEYDKWLDSQEVAASSMGISNNATALKIILDVFERNMHQLSEEWEEDDTDGKTWVPLESVIGRCKIPKESAKVIREAVEKMVGENNLSNANRWQALEYWAADYLGS